MLNPDKHGQLHPGLQHAAFVHRMSTELPILPLGCGHGTRIDVGFSRKATAGAPKRPSSASVLPLATRCQAAVVGTVLGGEVSRV